MSITLSIGERYLPGRSLLHHLDARMKIVATLAFVLAATATPGAHWEAFAALAAVLAVAVALGRLSPPLVLRRSALALPFLLVAVPLLFTKEGDELFTLPPVLWWHPEATDNGLEAFLTVLAKSWLSVVAAVVLTATTPPLELLRGLRGLGMPRIVVATVLFMYRYLFVIGGEAQRLLRARDARSARVGGRGGGRLAWRAKVLGNMVGSLFLRSYERSDRVFEAMTARGFRGEVRSLTTPAAAARDWLALSLLAALLLAIEVSARL